MSLYEGDEKLYDEDEKKRLKTESVDVSSGLPVEWTVEKVRTYKRRSV